VFIRKRRQPPPSKALNLQHSPLDIHSDAMHNAAMLQKELIAASTEPLILSLLSEGESYGYALIQRVRELSGDKIQWTDGMLYPVLHRLERQGRIKSRWKTAETGRKRKYYSILKEGRAALAEAKKQWRIVDDALKLLWSAPHVRT
jgi:PadR family transcriptional regulator, regulatory protein PadR